RRENYPPSPNNVTMGGYYVLGTAEFCLIKHSLDRHVTRHDLLEGKEKNMAEEQEIRLQRLQALREQSIDPYPNSAERTHTLAEVLEHFDAFAGPEGSFTLVGRIRLLREMGKAAFAKIEDGTGSIQVYFRINDVGEE